MAQINWRMWKMEFFEILFAAYLPFIASAQKLFVAKPPEKISYLIKSPNRRCYANNAYSTQTSDVRHPFSPPMNSLSSGFALLFALMLIDAWPWTPYWLCAILKFRLWGWICLSATEAVERGTGWCKANGGQREQVYSSHRHRDQIVCRVCE